MSRESLQLRAIEALSSGRLLDARAFVQQLLDGPREIRRGVCQYCGCSEARACGIVGENVMGEPILERCSWADAECTICTNVACLEAWRRESPAELDVDVHDTVAAAAPRSRLVLP